jgi:hypothetical protein
MKWSTHVAVTAIGLCVVVTSACDFELPCLLCPTGAPIKVSGEVLDDSLDLPPDSRARITLEGVRVEVLDGPDKGKFAITDPLGRYDLGPVALISVDSNTHLRASKDAWLPKEWPLGPWTSSPQFHLGQAPHVLWGCFSLGVSGGSYIPHVGVRVEIISGPAAGRVAFSDDTGHYRFGDMATQAQISLEISKAGYKTFQVPTSGALEGNQSAPAGCVLLQRE